MTSELRSACAAVLAALVLVAAGLAGGAGGAARAAEEEPGPEAAAAGAEKLLAAGEFAKSAAAYADGAAKLLGLADGLRREGKEPPAALWAEAEYCIHQAASLSDAHAASKDVAAVFERMLRRQMPHDLKGRLRWECVRLLRRTAQLKRAAKIAAPLGFVTDWQVIGPFDNERGGSFDVAYGPEKESGATDLEASYPGKKRDVAWRRVPVRSADGYVDLDAMLRPNDECLGYAVTFVRSGEATEAALRIACDDGVKAWLNDRLVLSRNVRRPCTFDQDVVGVRLKRGWNKLLLKISEQKLDWGFRARLTKADGSPLRGVTGRADVAFDYEPAPEDAEPVVCAPGALRALATELEAVYTTLDGKSLIVHHGKAGFRAALDAASGIKVTGWEKAGGARAVISAIVATKKFDLWTEKLGAYVSVPETAAVARSHYVVGELHRHRWARDVEKHPDREALYAATRLAPENALYLYGFSEVATDRAVMAAERDENRARRALEKVLELDPKFAVASMALGRYYLSNFGNTVRALDYYQGALSASPEFHLARLGKAGVFGARGWAAQRELVIREAARDDPGSATARMLAGHLEAARGNLPAAARNFEAALAVAYDEPGDSYRGALVKVYLEMGKLYKALEVLAQRAALSPFDGDAHFERAKLYAAAQEFPRAIEECKKAVAIAPEDHGVIAQLGHYYARIEKKELARAQWRRALDIQPNFVELDRYVEYVEGKTGYDERYSEDVSPLLAAAKEVKAEGGNVPAVVLLMKTIDRVHADGTSSRALHLLFKVMNTRGVRSLGSRTIPYLAGEQRVKVKVARVHRADGRIDEAEISVGDREPPRGRRWSTASVRMPPLQIGDVVELAYRVDETKQSFFGSYFGSTASFRLSIPMVSCKYILIVPKRRPVYFHLTGGAGQPVKTADDELDATVYTWAASDVPKVDSESMMPHARELVPTVYVSTYRNWKDFGSWYWDLVKDQHKMNAEMKAKVDELVAGCETDFEKIKAVYNYVVSDIRYVAWEFGVHGFKPYRANQIFDRKFGDCKDKAILINTMLSYLGIKAHPVLIRAEVPHSKQDLTLPMIQHFNHCISWVPAGKDYPEMFLDGTAIHHSIDVVPIMDEGATVCIVRPGGAEVKDVPRSSSDKNSTHEKVKIELSSTGDASAEIEAGWNGSRSPIIRQYFSVPDRRKLLLERLYGRHYAGTSCAKEMEFSDLTYLNQPVRFKYKLKIPRFMKRDGTRMKLKLLKGMLRGMLGSLFPNRMSDLATSAKREHDAVLVQRWSFRTEQEYKLPDGMKVVSKPEDCDLKTKYGRLKLEFKVEDRKLTVEKHLALDAVRIAPDEYEEFRRFCNDVDEKESREVILGPTE